jgi:hypothetical protein
MGFWSILLEIARAVAPHAPHVARAVADAAKEHRTASTATRPETLPKPSNQELADAIGDLEKRLSAAEEKAEIAEQQLALAEARIADQWITARKWAIGLLVWNAVETAGLIVLVILVARR